MAKKDKGKKKLSQKQWEEANKIRNLGDDKIFQFDMKKMKSLLQVAPWTKE